MKSLSLLLLALFGSLALSAQDIDLGTLPKITSEGTIERVIPMANGQYIITGVFDFIGWKNITRIARLNSDGSLDDTFNSPFAFDDFITDILVSDVGEVYVALRDNTVVPKIVKLTSSGAIVNDFNFTTDDLIFSLAWNGDDILAGGSFSAANGTSVAHLVSIKTDGSLNSAFNDNVTINFPVNQIKFQGEKIILTEWHGDLVERLNTDGSTDDSFQFDIDAINTAIGIGGHQYDHFEVTNDQIVINDRIRGLIILDADGTYLNFFDEYKFPTAMIKKDDEVLLTSTTNGNNYNLERYLPSTQEFEVLGNGNKIINDIAINNEGKVVLGGNLREFNSIATSSITKLDDLYNPTENFGIDNFYDNGSVNTISLQGPDKILIGGSFTQVNGLQYIGMARLNLDGTVDQSFSPIEAHSVNHIEVTADNKIYVDCNRITSPNGDSDDGLYLLNSDGSLDETSYTGPLLGFVALNGNKKLLYNGQDIFTLEDGTTQAFLTGSELPNYFASCTLSHQGNILLGSLYTPLEGWYASLMSYLPSGSPDPNFSEAKFTVSNGATPAIASMAVDADGKIWVSGRFDKLNGQEISHGLVKLNANGTLDTSFNPGGEGLRPNPQSTVDFINLMNDGSAIVTGRLFSTYNGTEVNKTFIVTSTGQISDNSIPINPRGKVLTGLKLDNGKYLYGGYFNFPGEQIRTSLGVLDLSEPEPEPDPVTAVNNPEGTGFNVYPNPTNRFLQVELPDSASPARLSIYSTTGQRIDDIEVDGRKKVSVDVSAWRPGVYLLKATSEQRSFYKKFLKN